jgi:tetratricopeptide (TPR) repeat protein
MPGSPNKITLLFADLKRRGVTRLATIYAVVGLGVIEAFDIIGGRFLMPDWTFRIVIILVLGGFPITMILGWIYDINDKRIVKTDPLTPTQKASIKMSWKPGWVSIILLVILILTTTAFFTIPRPNALGFKQQDWVLMADLENNTGDEVFEKSLVHALTVSIDQSRYINIFPRTQVDAVLQRMQRDTVKKIDVPIALEIAERENIKAVLLLTIFELSGTYVLSTSLLDPFTGETIRSTQVKANGKEEILDALGELATAVRKDLGESLQKIHLRTVPLYKATTHSLEALKYHSNAAIAGGNGQEAEAKELLLKAIELDPGFALAHADLAALYYWTNDREKGEEHISLALNLLDRLTEHERLWIEAAVEGYRGNREEAVVKWGTYLSKYPNSDDGWFRLGYNYMRMRQYEKSISAFTIALEIFNDDDPNIMINIASCYSAMGEYRKAVENYLMAFKLAPHNLTISNLNHEFGFTYVPMGEFQKAREVFEKMSSGTKEQNARGIRSQALLSMYLGKYSDAVDQIHESILIQGSLGYGLSELRDRLYLAKMLQREGMGEEYVAELDHCFEQVFEVATEPTWYFLLGKMIIRNGEIEKAELLLDEISKRINKGNRWDESAYSILKGEIELSKGNFPESLELLETGTTLRRDSYTLESLANYYFQVGDWNNAIATYEEMISDRNSLGWEAQECWVQAHLNLGIAYEEMDNAEEAIYYYRQFLELWKEADEDLPDLLEAKSRLEQLHSLAI